MVFILMEKYTAIFIQKAYLQMSGLTSFMRFQITGKRQPIILFKNRGVYMSENIKKLLNDMRIRPGVYFGKNR